MNHSADPYVYLSYENRDVLTGQCLLDLLGFPELNRTALIGLKHSIANQRCHLSSGFQQQEEDAFYRLPLLHSLTCPARAYFREFNSVFQLNRKIKLAGCAVIMSADSKVLLTRRTETLSLFPKNWVFPGGRLEMGESLEYCAIREAAEETGIDFEISESHFKYRGTTVAVTPLFIYESSFPCIGPPKAQHLIVFFTINLNFSSNEIGLSLQRSEVDYAVWISKEDYENINRGIDFTMPGLHYTHENAHISSHQLLGIAPNQIGEGVAEGHKHALDMIYQQNH
ncbi:unnamed protein product [Blepharisma stoltei]|uniref:Nudix hydrolase domain-containing protein n=1 Tax=Blepharisma stoltei TaxID=1481888 RepID=A0AAU9J092_9CILI|nr:unnamed protein product [Blepharisma stoltei]